MDLAKYYSRVYWSVARFLAIGAPLLTNHVREIIERAQAYLEEIQAATAAAHDRLRAGILRLRPQEEAHEDEPMPDPMTARSDPIFSTREFEVPTQVISTVEARDAIVNFDNETNE